MAEILARLDAMIAAAPDGPAYSDRLLPPEPAIPRLAERTGAPALYREEWELPEGGEWREAYERIRARMQGGAIVGLLGPRGTGKTRLACEVMRALGPRHSRYISAMRFFLRMRATYRKGSGESELGVLDELIAAPFLVLDEIQERGESAWEDRLLTHLIDSRYGAERPTLLIANLTTREFTTQLGESIFSRLRETGGVLELRGPSYRDLPRG